MENIFNQAGSSLPAMPHQQNNGVQHNTLIMEPGFVKARRFVQERIYDFLMQKQKQKPQVIAPKNVLDIVKRLEEGLFNTCTSKEEYMNLETMETRLHVLIKRLLLKNSNQQGNCDTSVAAGTMKMSPSVVETSHPSMKRMKMSPSVVETSQYLQVLDPCVQIKSQVTEVKKEYIEESYIHKSESVPILSKEAAGFHEEFVTAKQEPAETESEVSELIDLLVHSSWCRTAVCEYPTCGKVKELFRHGSNCKIRASGGCFVCKKLWHLIQLHAQACKQSQCRVPRCRDLKERLTRLQQQSDSRSP